MFDVGFWELALIGVVALLVVGPEKMPGLIRTAGRWAGQVQRMARDLRREIEFEAQTEEYRKLNREFLAEDKRLKEVARGGTSMNTPASEPTTPGEALPDATAIGEVADGPADQAGAPQPRTDAQRVE